MKQTYLRFRSYFPRPLPVGKTEFMIWSNNIIDLVGPIADSDSLRWAISNQVIHLPPQTSKQSDQYFIRSLRKAAANQVASSVFQDIKLKQQEDAAKAAAEATAAQSTAEVTATAQATPANEQSEQQKV